MPSSIAHAQVSGTIPTLNYLVHKAGLKKIKNQVLGLEVCECGYKSGKKKMLKHKTMCEKQNIECSDRPTCTCKDCVAGQEKADDDRDNNLNNV